MTPLLTLQNLSLSYPHKVLLQDVTFTLNLGDKIGVLGLNGHGKSSLFKIIMEQVSADTTVPPFVFDKAKNFSVFMVPQELTGGEGQTVESYFYEFYPELKWRRNKLDQINLALGDSSGDFEKLIEEQGKLLEELFKLSEERIMSQYLSYLKFFDFNQYQSPVSMLSGGEQRKVALALGLSAPHELILWDEPTNHLDLETIQRFEDELQSSKKTMMIISHDRSLLNNVVERIIHIQRGKLRSFNGTYQAYLQFLQEDQLRREKELDRLGNLQRRETAWIRRGVQARRTKSKKRIEDYSTLNKTINELKSAAHKSVSLDLKSSGRKSKILFAAENLALSFASKQLFQDLNFNIARGDKIALLGKNGVGKSSLLKLLLGQLNPTQGRIQRPDALDSGYFSQKREALKDEETPWSLIGEGIDFVISNTGEKRHVASYLENFLFSSDELKRPLHTFSGGEKNRLQLAHFMKHARDMWIFDEPTNDLDLETIGILEDELRQYPGALIVVSHDRSFIQNVTDKCWLLHDGKLEIFEGGLAQAEMFLEAVQLEQDLKALDAPKSKEVISVTSKMSQRDKKRLEQVLKEIESQEAKVADLQDQMSRASAMELMTLQKKLEESESILEKLLEEWSLLESRS